jgi:hypothetical protein
LCADICKRKWLTVLFVATSAINIPFKCTKKHVTLCDV